MTSAIPISNVFLFQSVNMYYNVNGNKLIIIIIILNILLCTSCSVCAYISPVKVDCYYPSKVGYIDIRLKFCNKLCPTFVVNEI